MIDLEPWKKACKQLEVENALLRTQVQQIARQYCEQVDSSLRLSIDNEQLRARVAELVAALRVAENCIGELSPTQARAEAIQIIQAAIAKVAGSPDGDKASAE